MRKKNKILFIYNKDKGGGAEDVMSNLFSRFQKDHDNIDKFLTHQKNNKVLESYNLKTLNNYHINRFCLYLKKQYT